jgi:hypothetical protein
VLHAEGPDACGPLFELPSNERWTGKLLWLSPDRSGWIHWQDQFRWRWNGNPPRYVEMRKGS